MRLPRECYPMADELTHRLPSLSRAQGGTLALWVLGTILAGRATQSAVEGALRPLVGFAARHAVELARFRGRFNTCDRGYLLSHLTDRHRPTQAAIVSCIWRSSATGDRYPSAERRRCRLENPSM